MPQISINKQIFELSPEKKESYWAALWPRKVSSRCHVDDIQKKFLQARPDEEALAEAQSEEIGRPVWVTRFEEIVQVHKSVSPKEIELEMSKRCKCKRRLPINEHRYLPGYCIGTNWYIKSKEEHPPQDVATNIQQMCPWPPTMNTLDGNAGQSSGSGQIPSALGHHPQSSHQAAAAGSSHQLTYEEQMILFSRETTKFMSLFPNDQGVPEPMNHGSLGPQCPPYNPLDYYQAYSQCQSSSNAEESSGQGNPSQHYDHTADQQRVQAQNGQQCNEYLPDWSQYGQDDGDGNGDGNGKNNRPGPYV
ncbi:hypothetical protein BCR37DRAFT_376417 [Protomyces lactucae-debilis]|uniref:Uncharacterized protein n=1 Tax=Protomyces lactucae-debilis TaxID=2754530 RepID=A0A1Y2FSV8_PROLT|nr:uncharacterized protein BCR37DRAFT_376417 [Protomyces lactucae-debilis]ORY87058.1 hypothetical protein BCR37DRAFT_376417 [Protomyces lactucae-debilis]